MTPRRPLVCVLPLLLAASGCSLLDRTTDSPDSHSARVAPGLRDGELAVPPGYRDWPVFLADIDKLEGKQIRDIYISPLGHTTARGDSFPDGTMSVMEIWNPKLNDDGSVMLDAGGRMMKSDLNLIFLMGKSAGAGQGVNVALRTGDWVYAGYQADGKTVGGPNAEACRGCHVTLPDNDWIFRYDEYFDRRDAAM